MKLEDSIALFFPLRKKRTFEEILTRLNIRRSLWIAAVQSGSLRVINWLHRSCSYDPIREGDDAIATAAAKRGDVELIELLAKRNIK